MTYGKPISHYTRTNVQTADKMDLVIMCYDKAIQLLHQARLAYEEKRLEDKYIALEKALAIINELGSSLNQEKGGQIAQNLLSIYTYLSQRLAEGDLKRDLSAFDEATQIMSELKEAWEQINTQEKNQPPEEASLKRNKDHFSQVAA